MRFRLSSTLKRWKTLVVFIENAHIRNALQSGDMKTHCFENAPFLVWTGENGGFSKRLRKKRQQLSFSSAFTGVLVWTMGESAYKNVRFLMKTH